MMKLLKPFSRAGGREGGKEKELEQAFFFFFLSV